MAKAEKRLERMRANPTQDWRIEDLVAVCKLEGVSCSPPKRGDHYQISHPTQEEILTIPAKRPIKPVYIRKLLVFIDRVRESSNG